VAHECSPGRRKIAVKVVDIFGNDIMIIVEVPYRESGVDVSFKRIESKGLGNGN
jgi:hypothetical protein